MKKLSPAEKKLLEEQKKRLGVQAIIADWDAEEREAVRSRLARAWEPTVFRVQFLFTGMNPAGRASFELFGDQLFCATSKKAWEIQPSEQAWRRFWAALERLGVWSWKPEYQNPEFVICDGPSWSVEIECGDRRLPSRGESAYPPAATAKRSREFKGFVRALGQLCSQPLSPG